MATFDYAEIADTAVEIITEFGQQTTLTRIGVMEGQVEDRTPGADQTFTVTVVDLDIEQGQESGTTVLTSKRLVYMGFSTIVVPQSNDQILLGGILETIVAVKPLAPAGITVLYEMELA